MAREKGRSRCSRGAPFTRRPMLRPNLIRPCRRTATTAAPGRTLARRRSTKKSKARNKSDIVNHVAARTSLSRLATGTAVNAVLSAITDALVRGETVAIAGFGIFYTLTRRSRRDSRRRASRSGRGPAAPRTLRGPRAASGAFCCVRPLVHLRWRSRCRLGARVGKRHGS